MVWGCHLLPIQSIYIIDRSKSSGKGGGALPMQETPLISKELFCTQVIENQEAMFRTARAILHSDEDA